MEPDDGKSLWDSLLDLYTEEEAVRWLTSPHPMLNGKTAAECLARGKTDVVFTAFDRITEGQVAT